MYCTPTAPLNIYESKATKEIQSQVITLTILYFHIFLFVSIQAKDMLYVMPKIYMVLSNIKSNGTQQEQQVYCLKTTGQCKNFGMAAMNFKPAFPVCRPRLAVLHMFLCEKTNITSHYGVYTCRVRDSLVF